MQLDGQSVCSCITLAVLADGAPAGSTPLTLELPAGRYVVELKGTREARPR